MPTTPKKRDRPRSGSKLSSPPLRVDCEDDRSQKKRQKTNHEGLGPSSAGAGLLRTENMYSFNKNVIDLTASPPRASPGARFPPGGLQPSNFNSSIGTKKLVVKNLRHTKENKTGQYYDQVSAKLDIALKAIFEQKNVPICMEELYRGVETVVKHKMASALSNDLRSRCKSHIQKVVHVSIVAKSRDATDIELLQTVTKAWATWRKQLQTILSIYYYLDRAYLISSSAEPTIEEHGMHLFREYILHDADLSSRIVKGASDLFLLNREEDDEKSDESAIFKQAIAMFNALSMYTKEVEPRLLADSQSFFNDWAARKVSTSSLTEYIDACQNMILREQARCGAFQLQQTTQRHLFGQMEEFLVVQHKERLVQIPDVVELMNDNNLNTLERLCSLLQLKGLGDLLRPAFEEYITAEGLSIIFDEKRQADMVPRLLAFKRKLDNMWKKSFKSHEGLGHSLREAFETFINTTRRTDSTWGTDNDKPGEMIAKYVDLILKGKGSRANDAQGNTTNPKATGNDISDLIEIGDDDMDDDVRINKQLDEVLEIFRFVHGKATFEAFYKKDLAKRLLLNSSASADAEKSMLTRLTSECGSNFTHNLEQMFKDIQLGREENSEYKTLQAERGNKSGIDLSVNILSAAAWPTYPTVPVEIPVSVQKAIAEYEEHYKTKYSGRKLEWKHSLAHCQMSALFPKGKKDISVSSFQAIVLLYFNCKKDNEPVGYEELKAATQLDDPDLKRTLQSLACAKLKVLTKSPKGKDINSSDTFVVNLEFSEPRVKFKINQIQLKETRQENKATHERVAADRQFETQAAIVRIMKAKKKIGHALLVAEVIQATKSRGSVHPEDIKKQIEKLIDKDYMERVEDGSYEYMA